MITLVEALNYRCLRYAHRPLNPFHILVGPNASGKTTFLDVIGFLSDLVSEGLEAAIADRTPNPETLLFRGLGDRLELAIEARIPHQLRSLTNKPELDTARYQLAIGFDDTERRFEIKAETLLLTKTAPLGNVQRSFFPMPSVAPDSLLANIRRSNNKVVINKVPGGNDNFYSETHPANRGWAPSFKLGSRKSALGNLVADSDSYPVATWLREYLTTGVQRFVLNSFTIRRPSPPTRIAGFLPDGSNLPWVVASLQRRDGERYRAWVEHLQTALPDLVDITTFERPEDRHCYMVYEYRGGFQVPSWLVSDGTLRLTALTLPAYVTDLEGIYLVEEPENGIHPLAVKTVYDSLSSMYEAQLLMATHSPVVLSSANMNDVLCFAKDDEGSTDIVLGSEHPALRQWKGAVDPGTLLGSGVLGE